MENYKWFFLHLKKVCLFLASLRLLPIRYELNWLVHQDLPGMHIDS